MIVHIEASVKDMQFWNCIWNYTMHASAEEIRLNG